MSMDTGISFATACLATIATVHRLRTAIGKALSYRNYATFVMPRNRGGEGALRSEGDAEERRQRHSLSMRKVTAVANRIEELDFGLVNVQQRKALGSMMLL